MTMLYLTKARKWYAFADWLALRKALKNDKTQPFTTDIRLARERAELTTQKGTFLAIAPATTFPKRPETVLRWDDDRHVFLCAGSRTGKGISYIINELLNHDGSTIVFDPAGENFAATAAYRQKILGQKIRVLDPFGITGVESDTWNPLAEIDFDNDPDALGKAYLIAESIKQGDSNNPFFRDSARKMIAMITAYVGARALYDQLDLINVRDCLMTGSPDALWASMANVKHYGGVVKGYAEGAATREARELGNTLETARTAMKWLDMPLMAQSVGSSTFSMSDLKTEKVTLYVVLPAGKMQTYSAWLRILFNAAFDAMQDLSVPKPERPVLFLMDEFPLLGKMERFESAAGEAAKFGVKLFICAQNIAQIKKHYDQGWETFIANSGLLIFFGNNDLETQGYIAARLGDKASEHVTYETPKPFFEREDEYELINPTKGSDGKIVGRQIEQLASRQSGRAFYFVTGEKPMLLPRTPYFERENLPKNLVYTPDAPAQMMAAE